MEDVQEARVLRTKIYSKKLHMKLHEVICAKSTIFGLDGNFLFSTH